MKRAIAAVVIVLACALLCGCQSLEERILGQIQLSDFADYNDYEQLLENGLLDEDGNYIWERADSGDENKPYAQIHVTFAQNSFLECAYYWDKELTEPIDTTYCYVDPGQCIYAAEPVSTNNISSQYSFIGFHVYEYDEDDKQIGLLDTDASQEPLTLYIPKDYTGTELSVEPYGRYNPYILSLADVWYDADGNANDVGGEWYVNNELFDESESEIDAFSSYAVRYEYDADRYYFISSSVETTGDTDSGQVAFDADAENDGSYLLELHPYTVVTLEDKDKNLVSASVNGQAVEVGKKTVELGNLKAGDTVTLVCKTDCKITCGEDTPAEPTETQNGRQYTYTVPESGLSSITFVVSELDHKKIDIDVDKNDAPLRVWNTVSGTISGWFDSGEEEESILTISNGTDSYDYEELQNRSDILLYETDELTITVNAPEGTQVRVSVDGAAEETLTGTMVLSYNNVNNLTIRVTSGDE